MINFNPLSFGFSGSGKNHTLKFKGWLENLGFPPHSGIFRITNNVSDKLIDVQDSMAFIFCSFCWSKRADQSIETGLLPVRGLFLFAAVCMRAPGVDNFLKWPIVLSRGNKTKQRAMFPEADFGPRNSLRIVPVNDLVILANTVFLLSANSAELVKKKHWNVFHLMDKKSDFESRLAD